MIYPEILQELQATHPAVAATLLTAYRNRVDHLQAYRNGVRFAGIEEWLQHLNALRESLERTTTAPKIAFLYERVRSDYVTALEATLSGYPSVTHDAMRDVMEVELLVRDFAADFPRLAQWLGADKRDLQRNFQPVHLRERHARRVGVEARQLPEAADYAGHSGVLHVNPHTPGLFRKGLVEASDTFRIDMCFWKCFNTRDGWRSPRLTSLALPRFTASTTRTRTSVCPPWPRPGSAHKKCNRSLWHC
jgi:hypothetical protein